MRRAIAFSLLILFSWTLMAPLFASHPEASLPPCCRRHGKHHCAMMALALRNGSGPAFTQLSERCPCRPAANAASNGASWQHETPALLFAGLCRQPLAVERTLALFRISLQRSHLKRGPPSPRMA
ncbi:MAG: hypothetical protein WCE75_06990 [Terracidiphilus sp.]